MYILRFVFLEKGQILNLGSFKLLKHTEKYKPIMWFLKGTMMSFKKTCYIDSIKNQALSSQKSFQDTKTRLKETLGPQNSFFFFFSKCLHLKWKDMSIFGENIYVFC